jgi:hypothetical protein
MWSRICWRERRSQFRGNATTNQMRPASAQRKNPAMPSSARCRVPGAHPESRCRSHEQCRSHCIHKCQPAPPTSRTAGPTAPGLGPAAARSRPPARRLNKKSKTSIGDIRSAPLKGSNDLPPLLRRQEDVELSLVLNPRLGAKITFNRMARPAPTVGSAKVWVKHSACG